MAKLVIAFGVTGTRKHDVLARFSEWCREQHDQEWEVLTFESQFLYDEHTGGIERETFLDSKQAVQHSAWQGTWKAFRNHVQRLRATSPNTNVLISLHGCFARDHYGTRTFVQPQEVAELQPDNIVTLLDNVYDMWWETRRRAAGLQFVGIPTLEQLLSARRAETMIADQVAFSTTPPIPHLVLSVHHPCETLWNWITHRSPKVVYLATPIAAPRRLQEEDDPSGIEEVDGFLRTAYQHQHEDSQLAVVSPLTIDELPLLQALMRSEADARSAKQYVGDDMPIRFDRESYAWDVDRAIGLPMLSPAELAPSTRDDIPAGEIRSAGGMIDTDVGWRDYRLVDQANFLVVFNPCFKKQDKISGSVLREIKYASARIPVFIYQDDLHDPGGRTKQMLFPNRGQMQFEPSEKRLVLETNSLDDLFRRLRQL